MMGDRVRGTVTPLSESISVQDAENVAKKVAEAVESQMQQLQTLQGFADENQSLTKLLLELPDLVSYNIMVPFGKAAFMPGRLIHTNEFLVLLGEGYYVERSSKQAAEILTRRSSFLTSKIDALKEQIKDLEAQASFAKETAAEAASGVVEIREEYMEPSLQSAVTSNMATASPQDDKEMDNDDEHARIMARLAELELAEEAAENDDEEQDDDSEGDMETDFRAALRGSLFDDSDDDDEEDDDEDEEGDGDVDQDVDDSTAANTILNRSAVRLTEIAEEQDSGQEFQSSVIFPSHVQARVPGIQETEQESLSSIILRGQDQTRGPGILSVVHSAAGSSEQRRVKFSGVDDIAESSNIEPLQLRDKAASDAPRRAFTGSVVERNTELLPPTSAVPEVSTSRPISKFRQRKG